MQEEGTLLRNSVDENAIASVVSKWTKIPIQKMLQGEKEKILHIKEYHIYHNTIENHLINLFL